VLNQGAHLFSENNLLRNMLSIIPFLSSQIFEKLCIAWNLFDGI
jgi:hypothetical protein